ncbi:MAG: acyl-CoA thioesterase [Chitinophagaceae bacterium]
MFTSSFQHRVRYADTDQMGVVYHGNYATYFEIGRVEAIRALGYSYKQMEADGIMMPIVGLTIQFVRPLVYDELFTIVTKLPVLPKSHEAVFEQEIINEQNKLVTKATVTLYFLDIITRKKVTMPEALLQYLQPFYTTT